MNPDHAVRGVAVFILLSSVIRSLLAWQSVGKGKQPAVSARNLASAILKAVGGLLASLAIWLGLPIFLGSGIHESAAWLAMAAAASSILDFIASLLWRRPAKVERTLPLVAAAAILILGSGALGFVLHLRSTPGGIDPIVCAHPPVLGRWRVATGGRTALTNHHHAQPPQQDYAVDLVIDGPPDASFGQIVHAPVDGEVTIAEGKRSAGDGPAEGNLIVIQTASGSDIWLAHLKEDSVKVARGDKVRAGAPLAAVGDTGSANSPHLHIHCEWNGRPVPIMLGPGLPFAVRGDILGLQAK
ncbi:MAG: M23 family metallopeptidase [Candidatus Sumerlaeaceae bacterium]|nr:M23 family metallopeptidase [Candidatus Sumerlaeaceae bacterium]